MVIFNSAITHRIPLIMLSPHFCLIHIPIHSTVFIAITFSYYVFIIPRSLFVLRSGLSDAGQISLLYFMPTIVSHSLFVCFKR